jgi:hypothetical protein
MGLVSADRATAEAIAAGCLFAKHLRNFALRFIKFSSSSRSSAFAAEHDAEASFTSATLLGTTLVPEWNHKGTSMVPEWYQ